LRETEKDRKSGGYLKGKGWSNSGEGVKTNVCICRDKGAKSEVQEYQTGASGGVREGDVGEWEKVWIRNVNLHIFSRGGEGALKCCYRKGKWIKGRNSYDYDS